ncbi:hypothetical protein HG15A2_15490 [Adhaeretor mobilis]|uniref:Uncharacterized protein n=1 Tax=Adhaeretor mobilis TaxID=1930276 RepID=A0A517MTR5_9BACT|nr:hypothetical protein HG15A2_15490 [Adhaeretor mobilis]
MHSHLLFLLHSDRSARIWAAANMALLATFQSVAIVALVGCNPDYQTSVSIDHSLKRGVLRAKYAVPRDSELGDYSVLETWCEIDNESGEEQIVVRLKGPHHGEEPRVKIIEPEGMLYRSVWSQRDGPPYEVWAAPVPLPDVLKLRRGNMEIELLRRHE